MNDIELYTRMMNVCSKTDAFMYSDHTGDDGQKYRIFNYRLSSFSDWLIDQEVTVWMRGTMFRLEKPEYLDPFIKATEIPVLVCRPFAKFFNVAENPINADWDLNVSGTIGTKHDGSLISSYIDADGNLKLKSKGSIRSEQALSAMAWLELEENNCFREAIHMTTKDGTTLDFEWCSPSNRIVLGYSSDRLIMLASRDLASGREYWFLCDEVVPSVSEFLKTVPEMKGIEGFVITLRNGNRVKVKTNEYLSLHRAKDGISSPKKVAQVILDEALDDLKSLFSGDQALMNLLNRMESLVSSEYNKIVANCESFYNTNKELSRKDYAIGATGTPYLGLLMNLYLGKPVPYKEFFMKNFDEILPDVDWYAPEGTSH